MKKTTSFYFVGRAKSTLSFLITANVIFSIVINFSLGYLHIGKLETEN